MRKVSGFGRRGVVNGLGAAALAVLASCAYPVVPNVVSSRPHNAPKAPADSGTVPDPRAPVVEVRTYSISPTVSIVAWEGDDASHGLRTWVFRSGDSLPAGSRFADHRLYIATTAIVEAGGPRRANIKSRELLIAGALRDAHACLGGNCLPATTYGVAIPDAVLRAHRDSLVVTFYTHSNSEFMVSFRGDLLDGYLRAVDSVSAALRSKATKTK